MEHTIKLKSASTDAVVVNFIAQTGRNAYPPVTDAIIPISVATDKTKGIATRRVIQNTLDGTRMAEGIWSTSTGIEWIAAEVAVF